MRLKLYYHQKVCGFQTLWLLCHDHSSIAIDHTLCRLFVVHMVTTTTLTIASIAVVVVVAVVADAWDDGGTPNGVGL